MKIDQKILIGPFKFLGASGFHVEEHNRRLLDISHLTSKTIYQSLQTFIEKTEAAFPRKVS